MKKFEKKVALVTGGSRGIGAAIVRRLAAEGASVAFTYANSVGRAKEIEQEILTAGGKALAIRADNAQSEEVIEAVNKTVSEFGRLDILVNNAGIYIGKEFNEHTISDYDDTMAVNVKAVYVAALEAVKHLQTGGRIITIGSNMGSNAIMPKATLYTMSKSALQGFTRGLARDLGPKGINVTLVQPGPIDTDMNPANTEFATFLKSRMALGEYGTGEDVAGVVAFLASEESKYITGSWVTIDGGFNA